jgi:hypothetical protein
MGSSPVLALLLPLSAIIATAVYVITGSLAYGLFAFVVDAIPVSFIYMTQLKAQKRTHCHGAGPSFALLQSRRPLERRPAGTGLVGGGLSSGGGCAGSTTGGPGVGSSGGVGGGVPGSCGTAGDGSVGSVSLIVPSA